MTIRQRETDFEARFIAKAKASARVEAAVRLRPRQRTKPPRKHRQATVVDGNSVGVSSDSSTVNVSVLDQGAFQQAVDLAKNNNTTFQASLTDVLGLAKDSLTLSSTAASTISDAYKTAPTARPASAPSPPWA